MPVRIYSRLKNSWTSSAIALNAFRRYWQSAEGALSVQGYVSETTKRLMRRTIDEWRKSYQEIDKALSEVEERFKL